MPEDRTQLLMMPLVFLLVACSSGDAAPSAPRAPSPRSFECIHAGPSNSSATAQVFERRDLQGGGATWVVLLRALMKRHATVERETSVEEMGHGFHFLVRTDGRSTWLGFDDEAAVALFCTPDSQLFNAVRADYEAANGDPAELARLLGEAGPELE